MKFILTAIAFAASSVPANAALVHHKHEGLSKRNAPEKSLKSINRNFKRQYGGYG